MRYILFFFGWLAWNVRAGWWYLGLGFRLFFAIGLDSDFKHGTDDVSRHFKCPIERTYRAHLRHD